MCESIIKSSKLIPASNESSGCLQTFDDCREGQMPAACCEVFDCRYGGFLKYIGRKVGASNGKIWI